MEPIGTTALCRRPTTLPTLLRARVHPDQIESSREESSSGAGGGGGRRAGKGRSGGRGASGATRGGAMGGARMWGFLTVCTLSSSPPLSCYLSTARADDGADGRQTVRPVARRSNVSPAQTRSARPTNQPVDFEHRGMSRERPISCPNGEGKMGTILTRQRVLLLC